MLKIGTCDTIVFYSGCLLVNYAKGLQHVFFLQVYISAKNVYLQEECNIVQMCIIISFCPPLLCERNIKSKKPKNTPVVRICDMYTAILYGQFNAFTILFSFCNKSISPRLAIWLILPVVMRLSQRLSHACASMSIHTVKLRTAHYTSHCFHGTVLVTRRITAVILGLIRALRARSASFGAPMGRAYQTLSADPGLARFFGESQYLS